MKNIQNADGFQLRKKLFIGSGFDSGFENFYLFGSGSGSGSGSTSGLKILDLTVSSPRSFVMDGDTDV